MHKAATSMDAALHDTYIPIYKLHAGLRASLDGLDQNVLAEKSIQSVILPRW